MIGPTYLGGVLQVRAYRVLQKSVGIELSKFGLKPAHWFILAYISECDETTSANIAELLKVEAPLVTLLTEDLVKTSLIKKKAHPTDGRAKLLVITQKGKRQVAIIEKALDNKLVGLLTGLEPGDLKTYKRVLEVIVKNGE